MNCAVNNNRTTNKRYVYGAYGELIAQFGGGTVDYWNIRRRADKVSGPNSETIGRKGLMVPPAGIGDIISIESGTYTGYNRFYYLKDHPPAGGQAPGSVRVTLNQNGSVVGHDDYYPFGLQMPGRINNSANRDDDQKFTGHFFEQEGDLEIYHAQARMYDPATGRFWGVDAMRSDMPEWNTYHYTYNNPVRYVDPDGNQGLEASLRWTFGWMEVPFYRIANQINQNTRALRDVEFNPQAITDIYEGSGKMASGYFAARSDLSVENIDLFLEGTQQMFDGIAEVAGTVENVSAVASLSGNPKAIATFGGASATASASDRISTGIEFVRMFTSDDVTGSTFINRAGWTVFNNSIPGRVPAIYQGRDDLQKTLIKAGVKETDELINQ